MAEVSWLVENRIIYVYSEGAGSVEGIKQADRDIIRLINMSSAPLVHIILNLENITEMPRLSDSIRARYEFPKHPQCGWSVFVGVKDPIQRMIVAILSNIFKARTRLIDNNVAAIDFLQSIDMTLPDLTAYKARFISKV